MPFEKKIAHIYPGLSDRLKQAVDFVIDHPVDIATRSLRSIAHEAGLPPVTFTRMARAVGFDDYEELRELMRESVNKTARPFSQGVERLQNERQSHNSNLLPEHIQACIRNLNILGQAINTTELENAVEQLHRSERVMVSGMLGSRGAAEYIVYMASFISDNWSVTGRMSASLGSNLIHLNEDDTLIMLTKAPFAAKSIQTAEIAKSRGAHVMVITDTQSCPALKFASSHFLVASKTPHFFSSYVTTIALMESIIGMLAARGGKHATERITKVEELNRRLEYL